MKPKKPKINEEHLPHGKENALTVRAIHARTGLPDETITNFNHRALSRELNARGVASVSCGKGFFLTDRIEDLEKYADDLLHRAQAILERLEAAILRELRALTKTPKLSMKSVMEWNTSEDVVRKGLVEAEEKLIHCPIIGVWAAVKKDALREG